MKIRADVEVNGKATDGSCNIGISVWIDAAPQMNQWGRPDNDPQTVEALGVALDKCSHAAVEGAKHFWSP